MTSWPADDEGTDRLQVIVDHPSVTIPTGPLRQLLADAVHEHGATLNYLMVILTDRKTVHTLNRDFLGHDYPTDVVSFPLIAQTDELIIDGEVYVDLDTAAERAPEFDTDAQTEAYRYAIHGTLHLLGFDDVKDEQRVAMRQQEDALLARLGDP